LGLLLGKVLGFGASDMLVVAGAGVAWSEIEMFCFVSRLYKELVLGVEMGLEKVDEMWGGGKKWMEVKGSSGIYRPCKRRYGRCDPFEKFFLSHVHPQSSLSQYTR